MDKNASNAGVRLAGSKAAPPFSSLVVEWRKRAVEYDERDREANRRKEYVIAAQQAGISCAFKVCASELETLIRDKVIVRFGL